MEKEYKKFSILRYELDTEESINIGVLYHNQLENKKGLLFVDSGFAWDRLAHFDEDLSIKFATIMLEGINDEVHNAKKFDIEKYIKFFCNEFKFSKVKTYEGDIEKIVEYYLKYSRSFEYREIQRRKGLTNKIMEDNKEALSRLAREER